MSQLIKSIYDKVVFTLAVGVVGLSVAWVWRQPDGLHGLPTVTPALTGPGYVATNWRLPEATVMAWPKAPTQNQGGGWLYEVFTPPVIYYNPVARSFAVTPSRLLDAMPGGRRCGLELLAVKYAPYRLQLLGYFGEPGDYLAAFGSSDSPATLLARPGRRFDHLGLTLKSFDVRKVNVTNDELGPVYDIAALAVLWDEQTGAEVVLDSRARKLTDKSLAVFRISGAKSQPREFREGDSFVNEDATYRVERIQLDPPEVVVARTTPGLPVPEMQVLRPAAQLAGQAPTKALAKPSTQSVASTGQ